MIMDNYIKFKHKFSRSACKADPIHRDLIKMEVSYDLKQIFCLIDHIVWALNFESTVPIQSQIPSVYVYDFSILSNLMVVGCWGQSGNEILKLIKLERYCHYNGFGTGQNGDIVWVAKTRHSPKRKYYNQSKDEFNEGGFLYVKFISGKDEFVAVGDNSLYKIDISGKVVSTLNVNAHCSYWHRSRNRTIDSNDSHVFISEDHSLSIYDIDTFSLIDRIDFEDSIYIVKALEKTNFIVILDDGTLYFQEDKIIERIAKIDKEIVAFDFDKANAIFYFGNSNGEVYAIDKNANLIMNDILDDSIRDVLVLNGGAHILFGGKNINYFLYENEHSTQNWKDGINFRLDGGNGMKTVFLSYSHSNRDLADFIDTALLNKGIRLTRDIRDIRYRQSIKEFMKSIRKTNCVFIIISKDYLQSSACMYEVLELVKDENYRDKIIPIINCDANIFDVNGRAAYIEYWQEQFKQAEEFSKNIDILNRSFYIEELKKIESIQRNLPEFLELVSDMNSIVCKNSILTDNEIQKIVDAINM